MHICLPLVAYNLIQLNLQTDSEICAERGLIELQDFTLLIAKSEGKVCFTSEDTDWLSALLRFKLNPTN